MTSYVKAKTDLMLVSRLCHAKRPFVVSAHLRRPIKAPPAASAGSVLALEVPFPNADLRVRVELRGGDRLTEKHLARVRRYLELAQEDLVEEASGEEAEVGEKI